MPYNRLSTAKIAKAVGCHPNTVRFYEQIGFLSPIARSPKGYRLYTEAHLDQARLVRLAMEGAWPGPVIRRSLISIIRQIASEDYAGGFELAHRHLAVVRLEREYAETAAAFLEGWAAGETIADQCCPLHITEAARLLGITVDMMRNWERSGLLDVPRDPANRYRLYHAPQLGRLRIIRMLRQAGYSPMAILRMLVQLDHGTTSDLRKALDTPRPDEDVYMAADHWLTTLAEEETRARKMITLVEEMVRKYDVPGETALETTQDD